MYDWISIHNYTAIYYHIMMIVTVITLLHAFSNDLFTPETKAFAKGLGFFSVFFIISYMGTRRISGFFGDMDTYAIFFNRIANGETPVVSSDYVFNYFMIFCTKIMSDRMFFFICALIYTVPCYVFSKKYFGSYWYYSFLIFIGSYMFWPYGTNGIRNGLGTAIFILSLCFYHTKYWMYVLMALAFGIHSSIIIPIAAFVVSGIYKNPKFYLYVWLAAIPLSLAGGGFWISFFESLGFADDRTAGYLTGGEEFKSQFSRTGFRWDFVLYSSFAVIAGWYFIFKKNISDKFYIHLWGTYIIANAFWILVIQANFSNRFAYLSWFLMAPVIAYPILRFKIFPKQYRVTGLMIAGYYLFTYLMFLKG